MSLTLKKVNGQEPDDETVYDLEELKPENKNYVLLNVTQQKIGSIGPFVKENNKWIYVNRYIQKVKLDDGDKIKIDSVELEYHEKA